MKTKRGFIQVHLKKLLAGILPLLFLAFTIASCSHSEKENDYPGTGGIHDTSSLHFFILSDWGFSGSGSQQKVADEMSLMARKVKPGFILTCGDNFQVAGVTSATDTLWKLNYENVYNDSSLQVQWYPALGNHDYLGNPDAQVAYSALSKTWNMPARFYSFVKQVNTNTYARFVVLDTQDLVTRFNQLDDNQAPEAIAQYSWLKNILAGAKEKWIFVTGHHPVFSASAVHGDTPELKALLRPLFGQYQVDFYICGHDHNFEHARENGTETDYIVTGTGGWVRPEGWNERTLFALSELGFTMISLAADSATLRFITADDHVGYSYVKKK